MSEYSRKLSSATKRILSLASEDENPESSFLIRIDGDLDEDRRSQLESLGINLGSVAGDVVVATAHLDIVPKLTALDFVSYVEAAGPMFLEPSTPESKRQLWDSASEGSVEEDAPDPDLTGDPGTALYFPMAKGEDCHEQD